MLHADLVTLTDQVIGAIQYFVAIYTALLFYCCPETWVPQSKAGAKHKLRLNAALLSLSKNEATSAFEALCAHKILVKMRHDMQHPRRVVHIPETGPLVNWAKTAESSGGSGGSRNSTESTRKTAGSSSGSGSSAAPPAQLALCDGPVVQQSVRQAEAAPASDKAARPAPKKSAAKGARAAVAASARRRRRKGDSHPQKCFCLRHFVQSSSTIHGISTVVEYG